MKLHTLLALTLTAYHSLMSMQGAKQLVKVVGGAGAAAALIKIATQKKLGAPIPHR